MPIRLQQTKSKNAGKRGTTEIKESIIMKQIVNKNKHQKHSNAF
jgi:hypothetical protein